MSVTLEAILDKMKSGTAETDFVQKLAAAAETPATVTDTTPPTFDTDEAKIAEALDAEGRVFARAFYDELNKIATEKLALNPPTGITPNRAQFQQMNPGIQNSVMEDAGAPEINRVVAILNSLVGNPTMPATKTEVGPLASPSAAPSSGHLSGQVTNAEMVRAKEEAAATSAVAKGASVNHNDVVSALYAHYFTGGNQ